MKGDHREANPNLVAKVCTFCDAEKEVAPNVLHCTDCNRGQLVPITQQQRATRARQATMGG